MRSKLHTHIHTHFVGLSTRPVVESIKKTGGVGEQKKQTGLCQSYCLHSTLLVLVAKQIRRLCGIHKTKLFIATIIL